MERRELAAKGRRKQRPHPLWQRRCARRDSNPIQHIEEHNLHGRLTVGLLSGPLGALALTWDFDEGTTWLDSPGESLR